MTPSTASLAAQLEVAVVFSWDSGEPQQPQTHHRAIIVPSASQLQEVFARLGRVLLVELRQGRRSGAGAVLRAVKERPARQAPAGHTLGFPSLMQCSQLRATQHHAAYRP